MTSSTTKLFYALSLLLFCNTSSLYAEAKPESAYLFILGVAQDAGYPQAGCYQPHCMKAWLNPQLQRLATSVALIDPKNKANYLFEATPDIKQQLFRLYQLTHEDEHTIKGIFLTHAHIGHYTGLMHFGHEAMGSKDIPVYSSPSLSEFLRLNGPWSQLVSLNNILLQPLTEKVKLSLSPTIQVEAFKVPHRDEYSETAGFKIIGPKRSALFIPDIDKWQNWSLNIAEEIKKVDYALIDGTFFADGELPGRDMSKIRHPFVSESMKLLANLGAKERAKVYFIHFNHSNPLLDASSEEAKKVKQQGFNIATEGLMLEL